MILLLVSYIYEVFEVSLLDVEENGSFVEVSKVGHVLHCVDAGLMHRHHVV